MYLVLVEYPYVVGLFFAMYLYAIIVCLSILDLNTSKLTVRINVEVHVGYLF